MTLVKERPRATKKAPKPLTGRLVACVLLVLAVWGTLAALAAPAATDVPVLRSTAPGVGSTIRPGVLVLTFDRPVDAGLATVRITDPYKRLLDPGRPTHADGRAETISVPLPKQKYAGTYAVAWHVPVGSHAAAGGTLTFDLASRSPAWPAPVIRDAPGVPVVHLVVQFAALVMLIVLAGLAFFVAITGVATVRRLVTVAWAGSFGCTLLALLISGPNLAKQPLSEVFSLLPAAFASGDTVVARLVLLGLVALPLAQLLSVGPPRDTRESWLRGATVLGCAGAIAATVAFAGLPVRSVSSVTQSAPTRLAFDTGSQQGFLDLVVSPARPGVNQVHVTVLDGDDAVRDGIEVTAVLNPPKGEPVPVRDGSARLPGPGEWELALTVRSADGKRETIYGVVDVHD